VLQYAVDFEITNRCNAHCTFCPRDATPHQGLMSVETFEQSLQRTIEIRSVCQEIDPAADVGISLCGLGEPLLHREIPNFIRRVRGAGFTCTMATNAALLDARRAEAVLDAGLQRVYINVGERGEDYDEIYALPFETTLENILRFAEMAKDQCPIHIVLVNHRYDPAHTAAMEEYWRGYGIDQFIKFDANNRGGSLVLERAQYQGMESQLARAQALLDERGGGAICGLPFWETFIGYDGIVYLCCSDWEKRVPLGSVHDPDSVLALSDRLAAVQSREPICKACTLDPLNHLAELVRAVDEGDTSVDLGATADQYVGLSKQLLVDIGEFEDTARRMGRLNRRRIPVRVV
jgi:organic radical activating enzyme